MVPQGKPAGAAGGAGGSGFGWGVVRFARRDSPTTRQNPSPHVIPITHNQPAKPPKIFHQIFHDPVDTRAQLRHKATPDALLRVVYNHPEPNPGTAKRQGKICRGR